MRFLDVTEYKSKTDKIQLEMLLEVDRICKKHFIPYSLFGGTLLGAIRHKGYIPWDDDIDICMQRKDYERFIEICKKELSSEYFLQTFKTDRDYYYQFAKIRKNGTLFLEYLDSELKNMHHGVFIDIFPLDNVIIDKFIGKVHLFLSLLLFRFTNTRTKVRCSKRFQNLILRHICYLSHYFLKFFPKKLWTWFHEKVITFFSNKDTKYLSHLTNSPSISSIYGHLIEKENFYDTIDWDFEGFKFPVPRNYDKILSKTYGDYMTLPPEEERHSIHYILEVKIPDK